MSCNHHWKKIGECWVCLQCGITKLPNGDYFFDREIIDYREPKKKKKKRVKHGEE